MRFQTGKAPQWKGKPKASPLDADADYLKLRTKILSGTMKPSEQAGVYIDQAEDGKRLGAKNPARLVRDHLRRLLKETNLEPDFVITCRQTAEPGVWGVWVTYEPREGTVGKQGSHTASQGGRRRAL